MPDSKKAPPQLLRLFMGLLVLACAMPCGADAWAAKAPMQPPLQPQQQELLAQDYLMQARIFRENCTQKAQGETVIFAASTFILGMSKISTQLAQGVPAPKLVSRVLPPALVERLIFYGMLVAGTGAIVRGVDLLWGCAAFKKFYIEQGQLVAVLRAPLNTEVRCLLERNLAPLDPYQLHHWGLEGQQRIVPESCTVQASEVPLGSVRHD